MEDMTKRNLTPGDFSRLFFMASYLKAGFWVRLEEKQEIRVRSQCDRVEMITEQRDGRWSSIILFSDPKKSHLTPGSMHDRKEQARSWCENYERVPTDEERYRDLLSRLVDALETARHMPRLASHSDLIEETRSILRPEKDSET